MFEIFKDKSEEEKPKNESELMGSRMRTEWDAENRVEEKTHELPTDHEVQDELSDEAREEDQKRKAA